MTSQMWLNSFDERQEHVIESAKDSTASNLIRNADIIIKMANMLDYAEITLGVFFQNAPDMDRAKRCPHGRYIDMEYMPAFAGGMSDCQCCKNAFGHFGGNPQFCPECDDGR